MSVTELSGDTQVAVEQFLLSIADDDFTAGQRLAEWVTVGPTMEEDNVLASMAQDEMGHARLWYELIRDSDDLDAVGYNRPPDDRRNSILVESEQRDFADTIVVNFLYDTAESLLLESMQDSSHDEIATRAEQALNEEALHVQHADRWLNRLVSTAEGRTRITNSFERLLPRSADLFAFSPEIRDVVETEAVITTDLAALETEWEDVVTDTVASLPIEFDPDSIDAATSSPETNGRACMHTSSLTSLLDGIHATDLPADQPAMNYDR